MSEYTEPTNEQLAAFMSVYAKNILKEPFQISPAILEFMFERDEPKRQVALRHHRDFQGKLDVMVEKIMAGEYQCDHDLKSGKQCPNFNVPGTHFCGLHQEEDDSAG